MKTWNGWECGFQLHQACYFSTSNMNINTILLPVFGINIIFTTDIPVCLLHHYRCCSNQSYHHCNYYITICNYGKCYNYCYNHDPVVKLIWKLPQRCTVIYDGYNIVSVCMFPVRRKALDRDLSLAFSKATNQTFVMGINTWQKFSWKSLTSFTETAGRWVSSDWNTLKSHFNIFLWSNVLILKVKFTPKLKICIFSSHL